MLGYLILAFVTLPVAELLLLVVLIQLTNDWLLVLAVVILTGIIGAALAKRQGLQAWSRIRTALAKGRVPGHEILEGLCIAVAAAFLVTPGVITDIAGFLLLVPAIHRWLARRLAAHFRRKLDVPTTARRHQPRRHRSNSGGTVIDVDAEAVDDESDAPPT